MKRIVLILSSLLLLLVVAAMALPFLVDLNNYRDQIASAVKEATGRELQLEGNIKLTVFPWVGVETGKVTFGNAQGFGPQPMFKVESTQVRVKLLPLFEKRLEADRIVAKGLALDLERDASGRTNWQDLVQKPASTDPKPTENKPAASPSEGPAAISGLMISGLSITDATLQWRDKMKNESMVLNQFNLETGQLSPGQAIPLSFKSNYEGLGLQGSLELDGRVQSAKSLDQFSLQGVRLVGLIKGKGYPSDGLDLQLTGDASLDLAAGSLNWPTFRLVGLKKAIGVGGSLQGTDIQGEKAAWQGEIKVDPMDLRAVLATLGKPLPAGSNDRSLRAVGFSTKLKASNDQASLNDLEVKLDTLELKGMVSLKDFNKPFLQFDLKGGHLDLDHFLPPAPPAKPVSDADKGKMPPASGSDDVSIPLPTISTPLAAQGSINLAILTARGMQIADPRLSLTLRDGLLRLDPVEGRLDNQEVRLSASLDSRGKTPRWEAAIKTAPLPLRALLEKSAVSLPKTADNKVLSTVSGTLSASGDSQSAEIKRMDVKLDDITLQGSMGVAMGKRKAVKFDLTVNRLDLDRYLPPTSEKESAPTAAAASSKPENEDEAVIPVAFLNALDLNGQIKIGELVVTRINIQDFLLKMQGAGGQHTLETLQGKLFQGTFNANSTIDVRGQQPHVTWQGNLRKVQVGPLTKTLLDKEVMTGSGNLQSNLQTDGLTKRQLKSNLKGTVDMKVDDGAIEGVDLVYQIQNAYNTLRGKPPLMQPKMEKTDFAEFSGSFQIDKGVIKNEDLKMLAKAINVTGSGLVADLPGNKMDYVTRVSLLTATGGLDISAVNELRGMQIPVRIHGALDKPSYGVAMDELLTAAAKNKALEKVDSAIDKKLGDKVSPDVKEGLKGALKGLKF
ncbi:MAG: AsmA family protein [Magnetococcales bacterium]|nr:AsmA family protein [Magnetococcales bacterium]NGZ27030.1 AsmA family protein [Magnetococcales bacterium]